MRCGESFDAHLRIQRAQRGARRFGFQRADARIGVQHLALQVAAIDAVVVDQRQRADAGRGEVERRGRSESAGADQRDARGCELLLSRDADFGQAPDAAHSAARNPRRARRRDRQAFGLPAREAAAHRGDARVAELAQRCRGEQRAASASADHQDFAIRVGREFADRRRNLRTRKRDRAARHAGCVLVVFAHIDQQRCLLRAQAPRRDRFPRSPPDRCADAKDRTPRSSLQHSPAAAALPRLRRRRDPARAPARTIKAIGFGESALHARSLAIDRRRDERSVLAAFEAGAQEFGAIVFLADRRAQFRAPARSRSPRARCIAARPGTTSVSNVATDETGLPGRPKNSARRFRRTGTACPASCALSRNARVPSSATRRGRWSASPADTPPLLMTTSQVCAASRSASRNALRIVADVPVHDRIDAETLQETRKAVAVAVVDLPKAQRLAGRNQFIAGRDQRDARPRRNLRVCDDRRKRARRAGPRSTRSPARNATSPAS